MAITHYLKGPYYFDLDTRRALGAALEMACIQADHRRQAHRPVAKTGERNPDVLCEQALEEILQAAIGRITVSWRDRPPPRAASHLRVATSSRSSSVERRRRVPLRGLARWMSRSRWSAATRPRLAGAQPGELAAQTRVASTSRTAVPRGSQNETLWKVFPIFGRDFIPAA